MAQTLDTAPRCASAKDGNPRGEGTQVGFFIRLPEGLAAQFPDLGPEDQSSPHVTFLYIGQVPEPRRTEFLRIAADVFAEIRGPVQADLDHLDYFVHPDKERKVAVMRVRFSHDMAGLRWRLRDRLLDAGFDVQDSFPLVYSPHVTLGYLPGLEAVWDASQPQGGWTFSEMEVWGLPQVKKVPFGTNGVSRTASTHAKSIALMKFLSGVALRLGVAKHVYIVGGAVRNFILGEPIKDIDVVLDSVALGKDSEWFAKEVRRAIPTVTSLATNQYGVAILSVTGDWELDGVNLKGEKIEIANARKESYGGESGKGYKPHTVAPATIEEDVVRREFTFNTLLWRLYDLATGPDKAEVIDLTGCGMADLKAGHMRCPSDPDKTFRDDPTRMLRAIKFTNKYGLKLTPDTEASIRRNAQALKNAPYNAIVSLLLDVVLVEPTARKALIEMKRLGLLDVVVEMMHEDKTFRNALLNWAGNQKVRLLFEALDLGIDLLQPLGFLSAVQQARLRELAFTLPEDEVARLIAALRQPGKVLPMPVLIAEFSLTGVGIQRLTSLAREVLLANPEMAGNPDRLADEIRKRMAVRTVLAAGAGAKEYRYLDFTGCRWEHWDHATQPRCHVPDDLLARIQTRVGHLGDWDVYRVDGELVRDTVDIRFKMGGNFAVYGYTPEKALWVEQTLVPPDMAATLLHEGIETYRMVNLGEDYLTAHDHASEIEIKFRLALRAGNPLAGFADALAQANFWFSWWAMSGFEAAVPEPPVTKLEAGAWVLAELGRWDGYRVLLVDPVQVRSMAWDGEGEKPIDFTMSGHHARQGYVPEDELWLANDLSPRERACLLLRTGIVDTLLREGDDLDDALDTAHEAEVELRARVRAGAPAEEALRLAGLAYTDWTLAHRVMARHLAKVAGFFNVGDPILYGKYKNKHGIIRSLTMDEKGHPVIEIEPVPKGRKQNKVMQLFKIWHDPNPPVLPPEQEMVVRVAAKYQEKKKVKTEDGDEATVYVYSERQVAERNKAKAERIEKLRGGIDDLRKQYKKDLDSDDPKTKLTALAVALIDETYERVGNEESAEDGHYGVTGWLMKHLTLGSGKATIRYVGKSGVKHEKTVEDKKTLSVLRAVTKGKPKDEQLLCEGDDCKVAAEDVNAYLKPFDVTAKDLRGFHANREMQERLKAVRSKGGKLPEDKKEREKALKAEFKEALAQTAEAVGHEPATLKSQYLVPGLEEDFMDDGSVNDSLKKKGSLDKTAIIALVNATDGDDPDDFEMRGRFGLQSSLTLYEQAIVLDLEAHDEDGEAIHVVETEGGKYMCLLRGHPVNPGAVQELVSSGYLERDECTGDIKLSALYEAKKNLYRYEAGPGPGHILPPDEEGYVFDRDHEPNDPTFREGQFDSLLGPPEERMARRVAARHVRLQSYAKPGIYTYPPWRVQEYATHRMLKAAALSRDEAKLLQVWAKGQGATATYDMRLVAETLAVLGWLVAEKMGARAFKMDNYNDQDKVEHVLKGWLRQYKGNAWSEFIEFDSRETAEMALKHAPFEEVSGPPGNPDFGKMYVKGVQINGPSSRDMVSRSPGRTFVTFEAVWIGLPLYTFRAKSGGTLEMPLGFTQYEGFVRHKTGLSRFLTWAYKNGLKDQAAAALLSEGEDAVARLTQPKSVTQPDKMGTCPVCFRVIAVSDDDHMMRHGWSVQGNRAKGQYGSSWHTGPCPGTKWPPFEISPEGTKNYLTALAKYLVRERASLQALKAYPDTVYDWQGKALKRPEGEPPEFPDYDRGYWGAQVRAVRELSRHIEQVEKEQADLEKRVAAWKPMPLPSLRRMASAQSVLERLRAESQERFEAYPRELPFEAWTPVTHPWAFCPVCGEKYRMSCRCHIGDKTCPNGHSWIWCKVHERAVVLPPGVDSHKLPIPREPDFCRCRFADPEFAAKAAAWWAEELRKSGWKVATKTPAEKEDEEAERLVRPLPKDKPPRHDLRRERVKEDDPDTEKPNAENDKDLSLNYKKIAKRVAFRWLTRLGPVCPLRVAMTYLAAKKTPAWRKKQKGPPKPPQAPKPPTPPKPPQPPAAPEQPKHKPGDVWESTKNKGTWVGWAMTPDAEPKGGFKSREKAQAYVDSGKADTKKEDKGPDVEIPEPEEPPETTGPEELTPEEQAAEKGEDTEATEVPAGDVPLKEPGEKAAPPPKITPVPEPGEAGEEAASPKTPTSVDEWVGGMDKATFKEMHSNLGAFGPDGDLSGIKETKSTDDPHVKAVLDAVGVPPGVFKTVKDIREFVADKKKWLKQVGKAPPPAALPPEEAPAVPESPASEAPAAPAAPVPPPKAPAKTPPRKKKDTAPAPATTPVPAPAEAPKPALDTTDSTESVADAADAMRSEGYTGESPDDEMSGAMFDAIGDRPDTDPVKQSVMDIIMDWNVMEKTTCEAVRQAFGKLKAHEDATYSEAVHEAAVLDEGVQTELDKLLKCLKDAEGPKAAEACRKQGDAFQVAYLGAVYKAAENETGIGLPEDHPLKIQVERVLATGDLNELKAKYRRERSEKPEEPPKDKKPKDEKEEKKPETTGKKAGKQVTKLSGWERWRE